MPRLAAGGRQRIEPARGGKFHRLQRHLGAGAADDDGEMIRRARRRAERAHFAVEEFQQALRRQDRARLLKQEALVCRPAAFGDEHQMELVGVRLAWCGHDVELHRKVIAGIDLLEHRQRGHLRVAQVRLGVGAVHTPGQRLFLVAIHPDALTLLSEHQRSSGVLAHRQHTASGDIGILQQIERHEPVVRAGLRVIEDGAQLRQMSRPQKMRHVAERLKRQLTQCIGGDAQHRPPVAGCGVKPSTGSSFHCVRSGPSGNIGE